MAQIFHRSFNTISRVSIFGALFLLAGLGWAYDRYVRSDYVTGIAVVREQPVPFSHKHHVSGLGIDCRYCHTSVEESGFAGIPPTRTCMNCHSQIWTNSPLLAPVRQSYDTDKSLHWVRVHDLPDFVYFNHAIHVKKGVGCSTCHGPIQLMDLTWQYASLHMEWCLECHRHPERYVRPQGEVFNMEWRAGELAQKYRLTADGRLEQRAIVAPGKDVPAAPAEKAPTGDDLVRLYQIQRKTDCSTCHR